ncbi:carboxymuconolactone decarboxylase family protein [Protofrankia symbiont of Coriaria ruscifolia]|uniref:Alkylhydroperoxidase n=1 Tax=Candidatus Protofrankia californiensis TaxID=1839754 RepID=A0A1C3PH43_9ACTN|nr:carboxymuconolactone decarboxylase family protein [Protofrankia symbiont of Coriaria ruscifolia]SBW29144.1 alkylhydroperoxidase [Candidatus Protofrankia californiensis]
MSERISISKVAPAGYQAVAALQHHVTSTVDPTLLELVKLRASILNSCAYCIDMHSRHALAAGEDSRRLFAVAAWSEAPFFNDRERAALALTDAVTRLGEHGVADEVWDGVVKHWSDEEVANLILAIATINVWNRIAVSTGTRPPVG